MEVYQNIILNIKEFIFRLLWYIYKSFFKSESVRHNGCDYWFRDVIFKIITNISYIKVVEKLEFNFYLFQASLEEELDNLMDISIEISSNKRMKRDFINPFR